MSANERERGELSLGRDTRTVAGLTLVSRLLGLVRDLVTVRVFGDTLVGSAFAAAFAVPNVFRRLFGEGALSAAFIPRYTRLVDGDGERADALASVTIAGLALVTGLITIVAELALLAVIVLFPGGEGSDRVFSLQLVMVMLPFMPLICVAAILGGMLQSHGRFGPWAAAPVLLNLCVIGAAVPYFFVEGASSARWAYYIGGAAVVSALLQVLWSLWALRGCVRWTRAFGAARGEARAMLIAMAPVIVGLGTLQLNSLADTVLAMYPAWIGPTLMGHGYPLDERANAVLFFSQRLYQFPLGVFGIAIATAAFPALARVADDTERFGDMLRRGLRLSVFIGLPASVGLMVVVRPLVSVLYGGDEMGFSAEGVARARWVLVAYSAAVWAYSVNQLLTRAFFARGDTKGPMRIALKVVGLNLVLNCTLIWWIGEAGLAVSTALCAAVQSVMLARALGKGFTLIDDKAARSLARTAVLSAVSGLGAWGAMAAVSAALGGGSSGMVHELARLGAGVLAGVLVVLVGAWRLRMPELWWISARSTDRETGAGG